jgi:methyl-accepting chemotaxis protein
VGPGLEKRLLLGVTLLVLLLVGAGAWITDYTTSALLALVAIACSWWGIRRLMAPLKRLSAHVSDELPGDIHYRIPVSGSREVAGLTRAFNALLDKMQKSTAETASYRVALSTLNETLEDQVWERTLALQTSEEKYRALVENSSETIRESK